MELIKKLQEEEESMRERAEERRRMQEEEETCCDICMCNLYEGEWIPLLGCIHMFHTECVKEHMKAGVKLLLLRDLSPGARYNREVSH